VSRIELGADDIRRAGWYGLKPAVAKILGARIVNSAVQLTGRTLLPTSLASRLPLNKRSVAYRLDNGGLVRLLDPLHDIVARDIYWGRQKAVSPAERHKLACLELLSRQSDLFLDVGAYSGLCSLIAARTNPQLKAIAYDIVPENYLLLARNIIENNVVAQVEPRLRGLGAETGTLTLPVNFGAASHPTSISLGSKFTNGASIPVVTLDDDIIVKNERILIKIDVEGFEDQVLKGAQRLLRQSRPHIICEILPGNYESATVISELLGPLGYRWFCFEDSGLEQRNGLEPGSEMRDWLLTVKANPDGRGHAPRRSKPFSDKRR